MLFEKDCCTIEEFRTQHMQTLLDLPLYRLREFIVQSLGLGSDPLDLIDLFDKEPRATHAQKTTVKTIIVAWCRARVDDRKGRDQ